MACPLNMFSLSSLSICFSQLDVSDCGEHWPSRGLKDRKLKDIPYSVFRTNALPLFGTPEGEGQMGLACWGFPERWLCVLMAVHKIIHLTGQLTARYSGSPISLSPMTKLFFLKAESHVEHKMKHSSDGWEFSGYLVPVVQCVIPDPTFRTSTKSCSEVVTFIIVFLWLSYCQIPEHAHS